MKEVLQAFWYLLTFPFDLGDITFKFFYLWEFTIGIFIYKIYLFFNEE